MVLTHSCSCSLCCSVQLHFALELHSGCSMQPLCSVTFLLLSPPPFQTGASSFTVMEIEGRALLTESRGGREGVERDQREGGGITAASPNTVIALQRDTKENLTCFFQSQSCKIGFPLKKNKQTNKIKNHNQNQLKNLKYKRIKF